MNRALLQNSNRILKKILCKEENLDIVKEFIEAILHIKIQKVISRHYVGSTIAYLPPEEDYGVVNVRVIKDDGEQLNVGIQIVDGLYVQERVLMYGASIHVNQEEYEDYSDMAKTITINIFDFDYFSTDVCHKVIKFCEREKDDLIVKDSTEFHILELPKFDKAKNLTQEDAWIVYLKGDNSKLMKEAIEKCPGIKKLDKLLQEYWDTQKL